MTVTNPAPAGSSSLVSRVQAILMSPKTEWERIAAEPATVQGLFTGYACILALLPLIGTLIARVLLSGFLYHSAFGIGYSLGRGVILAVIGYVLSLVSVYVVSLVINALAPSFDAKPDPIQALKVAVYAQTAGWVVGLVSWVPVLGWLLAIAAMVYGLYLLYLGLLEVMKPPAEKAIGYTVVVIVVDIVIFFVVAWIVGMITAMMFVSAALTGATIG